MIDEKKIEEAAKECRFATIAQMHSMSFAHKATVSQEKVDLETELIENAFIAGIEWYKKKLWHPMSDKPEMGSEILIQRNMEVYHKNHPAMGVDNTFVHEFDYTDNWESYAHDDEYKCWLYIDDLMKGGK